MNGQRMAHYHWTCGTDATRKKAVNFNFLCRPAMPLIFLATIGWMFALMEGSETANNDIWPLERPNGMPSIQSLEVMCGKDHMDVHLQFSQPFEGIVSSKGQYGDPRCVYVPPSTGKNFYKFRIAYSRCGTKPDLNGQFYENTVVVQYDKDLLEVWDEAKRLRCEWYNDYEKTASKPPMVIADLDVIQLDFRGDNVDCWMEIQHGKGPWAPPVSGIVPLGSTLTLVVAINDFRGEFDMRVKSCAASDGGGHIIQLSDEHGCVLRPKMISRFLKAKISDERATVLTYAFFHAFKFPDALSVHIKCKVEICRHGCLDHCQLTEGAETHGAPEFANHEANVHSSFDEYNTLERKDSSHKEAERPGSSTGIGDLLFDDKPVDDVPNEAISYDEQNPAPLKSDPPKDDLDAAPSSNLHSYDNAPVVKDLKHNVPIMKQAPLHHTLNLQRDPLERFPHGPRKLKSDLDPTLELNKSTEKPLFQRRRRRSFIVSDAKTNANVGVSGLYDVISEADLAFTPDNKDEAVAVFQGKIREEVVYGICLPVQGFSAIFALMALCAIISAVVAGYLLYRYQLQQQKQRAMKQRQRQIIQTGTVPVSSLANWMALRLIGTRADVPAQRKTGSNHKS